MLFIFVIKLKVAGLKSGKIIKEFRGHTCLINDILFLEDGMKLASGGTDGNLRIWNYVFLLLKLFKFILVNN